MRMVSGRCQKPCIRHPPNDPDVVFRNIYLGITIDVIIAANFNLYNFILIL
jgi:hypothetical protein